MRILPYMSMIVAGCLGWAAMAQAPGPAPAAFSADSALMAPDVANGKVQSIDSQAMTFTVKKGSNTQTFRTSEDTVFTLDGREVGMMEALKAGRTVRVTHKDGLATAVAASSS